MIGTLISRQGHKKKFIHARKLTIQLFLCTVTVRLKLYTFCLENAQVGIMGLLPVCSLHGHDDGDNHERRRSIKEIRVKRNHKKCINLTHWLNEIQNCWMLSLISHHYYFFVEIFFLLHKYFLVNWLSMLGGLWCGRVGVYKLFLLHATTVQTNAKLWIQVCT